MTPRIRTATATVRDDHGAQPRAVALAMALAGAGLLAVGSPATAQTTAPSPSSAPVPTAVASSPCLGATALLATVDRPGTGRVTATGGSPCVTPPGQALLELGYRNQVTSNGRGSSMLTTYPLPLLRVGVDRNDEVVLLPPTFDRRTASGLPPAFPFTAAHGWEDSGIGVKRALGANARTQTAVGFLYTAPTGFPAGTNGFSAGGPGYALSFTASYAVNAEIGANLSEAVGTYAGPDPTGVTRRFFASSPSLTLSFALGERAAFLAQAASTSNTAPGAGSSTRVLAALQRLLSPNILVDVEVEQNLNPPLSMTPQHAIGTGVAIRF